MAILTASLGLSLTASASATDYSFQSWRGVKCTLRTSNFQGGPKSDKTISYSSKFWCNRPLVRIEMWSYLIKPNPTPHNVHWSNDECNDSRTCGTAYQPYTSGTVQHQVAGVYAHQTDLLMTLNGRNGDSDPTDPRNDWWIAADLRAQCVPGAWGVPLSCDLYEPIIAEP